MPTRNLLAALTAAVILAAGFALLPHPTHAQTDATPLPQGWTNLAYDGETLPLPDALTNAQTAIDAIWHWDAATQDWTAWFPTAPIVTTLDLLANGEVYWVHATRDVDWLPQRAVLFQRALLRIDTGATTYTLDVELADTPQRRGRGLMFRQELAPDSGMLFLFPSTTTAGFWMQNTYVPLSIAFIDADGVIIDIQDMAPLTTDLHSPGAPYLWALEMEQGWFAANGVGVGAAVALTGK